MRFLHPSHDEQLELSLDDVFLIPGYFDGYSRLETDLTPGDFVGSAQPLVSANMNGVTGRRMAEGMARLGGLGVLPQDMDGDTVERIVRQVKGADARYDTPLYVEPTATLRDVRGILGKRPHNLVVVINEHRRPLGVVTDTDLKERDQYTPAGQVMSEHFVTAPLGIGNLEAFELMEQHHIHALPIINDDGQLHGVLTKQDAVRYDMLRPALDRSGRLMIAVAVGIAGDVGAAVERALAAGVDAVVLDTAHGHQERMLAAIKVARSVAGADYPLIAGNVCTPEGTRDLLAAGADVVKVNVGPGAMCTTRMQTGVGRPTFSSVLHCAAEARRLGKHVWGDGGVKAPRDVALYLAAGAARVMVGTLLAGTFESPGDIKTDSHGQMYKVNSGMASGRAVRERTHKLTSFERAKKSLFREGISTARIYLQDGRESVGAIVSDLISGVQSSFTYVGARTLEEYHQKAVVGVQTPAGYQEGKPRDSLAP